MGENVTFLFDLVVTHLEIFNVQIEDPLKLLVETKVAGKSVKVTSSRLNVNQFVANRELELAVEPSTLRQILEEKGMTMGSVYDGSTLGTATMVFPLEFLDKISSTMNDLLHEETLDLVRRANVVGTISILIRLTLKCEYPPENQPLRKSVSRASRLSLIAPRKTKRWTRELCQPGTDHESPGCDVPLRRSRSSAESSIRTLFGTSAAGGR